MMRKISSQDPGVLTKVGMKTFVDPRIDGGRINDAAKEAKSDYVVELVQFKGEDYLFYPAFDIHVALIKGSFADEDGNISTEKRHCKSINWKWLRQRRTAVVSSWCRWMRLYPRVPSILRK